MVVARAIREVDGALAWADRQAQPQAIPRPPGVLHPAAAAAAAAATAENQSGVHAMWENIDWSWLDALGIPLSILGGGPSGPYNYLNRRERESMAPMLTRGNYSAMPDRQAAEMGWANALQANPAWAEKLGPENSNLAPPTDMQLAQMLANQEALGQIKGAPRPFPARPEYDLAQDPNASWYREAFRNAPRTQWPESIRSHAQTQAYIPSMENAYEVNRLGLPPTSLTPEQKDKAKISEARETIANAAMVRAQEQQKLTDSKKQLLDRGAELVKRRTEAQKQLVDASLPPIEARKKEIEIRKIEAQIRATEISYDYLQKQEGRFDQMTPHVVGKAKREAEANSAIEALLGAGDGSPGPLPVPPAVTLPSAPPAAVPPPGPSTSPAPSTAPVTPAVEEATSEEAMTSLAKEIASQIKGKTLSPKQAQIILREIQAQHGYSPDKATLIFFMAQQMAVKE